MEEIDFNNEEDLKNAMKEHGVEELKDKRAKWKLFLISAIKWFLVWTVIYGLYRQGEWICNHVLK